jgi:Suppressor of fused protein (SUFU)
MTTEIENDWLERIWEDREERVYPTLFGKLSEGIYTLSAEIFLEQFQQETYDPRWLFCGVFESPPSDTRANWLYVTSGLSNPWDDEVPDPTGMSGLGCEFVFETTEQAQWAIRRLHELMAYQILLCHGRYGEAEPMGWYDRMPLRNSIDYTGKSAIQNLMLCPPANSPEQFHLDSGEVIWLAVVGITDEEKEWGRQNDGEQLLALLKWHQAFPVTNIYRGTISLP